MIELLKVKLGSIKGNWSCFTLLLYTV